MAYTSHVLTHVVSTTLYEGCGSLSPPFIRGGNQGIERLSDLPTVPQLVSDAASIQSQSCLALYSDTFFNKAATVYLAFTHNYFFYSLQSSEVGDMI